MYLYECIVLWSYCIVLAAVLCGETTQYNYTSPRWPIILLDTNETRLLMPSLVMLIGYGLTARITSSVIDL